jgi:hypothetical protein
MRTFSVFFLLIYWSVIILAPIMSKNDGMFKVEKNLVPINKPNI